MKQVKIGNIKLKNPFILAPMVDVTDLPFRLLCIKAGASLAYTEMLYIDAILHENPKTKKLMQTSKADKPLGIQITGNSEKEFEKLIPYAKNFDLIDINCGCPSIKLIRNQAGSFLLNNPEKIAGMIKILKKSGKPVTAKIRLGFKSNNALKIAKMIEKAGADAITVHARLAIHGNNIPADWKQIKLIKQNLKIPVIGNGDILKPEDALRMLKETGCDAVMIARGALSNPLIFKQILQLMKTGKYEKITEKQKIRQFKQYIKLAKKHNIIDIGRIKYLGSNFLKGISNASKLRQKLMSCKSLKEIETLITDINLKNTLQKN